MRIFDNIPAPQPVRAGRPAGVNFGLLGTGQSAFFAIPDGQAAEKVVERVKGQIARWRKTDEAFKNHKFTVAVALIPEDPLGAQGVGVWRTA
jgi:hypothetical protein